MKDDVFLKEFGFRMKYYRIKCSLTQAQLGEKVDMSEHRISQIENGRCNVTLKTVNRISEALNILAVNLFNFE
jgi:DNA-binding XRE family transcriptional regulator